MTHAHVFRLDGQQNRLSRPALRQAFLHQGSIVRVYRSSPAMLRHCADTILREFEWETDSLVDLDLHAIWCHRPLATNADGDLLGGCILHRPSHRGYVGAWRLDLAWTTPAFRRLGIFKSIWLALHQRYPGFIVEEKNWTPPFSHFLLLYAPAGQFSQSGFWQDAGRGPSPALRSDLHLVLDFHAAGLYRRYDLATSGELEMLDQLAKFRHSD